MMSVMVRMRFGTGCWLSGLLLLMMMMLIDYSGGMGHGWFGLSWDSSAVWMMIVIVVDGIVSTAAVIARLVGCLEAQAFEGMPRLFILRVVAHRPLARKGLLRYYWCCRSWRKRRNPMQLVGIVMRRVMIRVMTKMMVLMVLLMGIHLAVVNAIKVDRGTSSVALLREQD